MIIARLKTTERKQIVYKKAVAVYKNKLGVVFPLASKSPRLYIVKSGIK